MISNFDPFTIWLVMTFAMVLIIALGGFVHGALGLGFPLVTTPLLATMMDVKSAILVTLIPTAAVNIVSLVRGGGWLEIIRKYWLFAFSALIGTVLSTHLLIVSDPEPFRLILAAIVLLYLFVSRLENTHMGWVKKRPMLAMGTFGLIAGLSAGTTNVMVPILIIFALESAVVATVMVQMFNLFFLTGKASQIVVLSMAGLVTPQLLLKNVPLAAVAVAFLFIGMKIRARISTDRYKILVRYLLGTLATLLIAQFVLGRTAV